MAALHSNSKAGDGQFDTADLMSAEEWEEHKQANATEQDPSGKARVLRFLSQNPALAPDPVQQHEYAYTLVAWLMYEGPLPHPRSPEAQQAGLAPPKHSLSFRQLKRRRDLEKKKQKQHTQKERTLSDEPQPAKP